MSRAWLFQDHRQRQKLGGKAPWSVGYLDPDGRRKSKKIGCKSLAEKFARKIEGQLAAGTYEAKSAKKWAEFRAEYEKRIVPRLSLRTAECIKSSLDAFERLVKPARVAAISTATIDEFIAARQLERGKKPESTVSPASVNRDLRHLKAVLRIAHEWGYLAKPPKFRKLREDQRIGRVITPEHFQAIYRAAAKATLPEGLPCSPGDWWQALLMFAMTTGWRIKEILSLRREDLNLETGAVLTRAADNKGGRDDVDHLPLAVVQQLKGIVGFGQFVFLWPYELKSLWKTFHEIQSAAGIKLTCQDDRPHVCTPTCHCYGFHALRRGYATLNADHLPAVVLQRKMRHKSFTTTQRYICLADKMKAGAERVYVPQITEEPTETRNSG